MKLKYKFTSMRAEEKKKTRTKRINKIKDKDYF